MTDGNGSVAKMGALTIAALETDAPNHAEAYNIIIIFQNMIRRGALPNYLGSPIKVTTALLPCSPCGV